MKKLFILVTLLSGYLVSCEKEETTYPDPSSNGSIAILKSITEPVTSAKDAEEIRLDTIRISTGTLQGRSSWHYLTGWSFTSEAGWHSLGYIPKSYLESHDVLAVITSGNHTGAIFTHGWSPFRGVAGLYVYSATSTTLELNYEDLQNHESRGYFHTYSWAQNTTYQVDFYVKPRPFENVAPNLDDYPFPGQSACHINNGCTEDPWRFCEDNCTSWVAWKVNQAQGVTDMTLEDWEYPFYNYMTSPRLSHAKNWDTRLAAAGFTVNDNPQRGCIAQWEGASWNYDFGHVAYVHEVSSNGTITVSEYNYSPLCEYNTRTISPSDSQYPDNFIHVQ